MRVLALGDVDHREFREGWRLVEHSECIALADGNDSGDSVCDLVLVFQSRPGSVDAGAIGELQRRHPLAGFVTVLGTWCEGETRTGRPLPSGERVFWYQFQPWWRAVESAWRGGRPTSWQQSAASRPIARDAQAKLVAIDAPDADAAEALFDALAHYGWTAVWHPRGGRRPLGSQPTAGVWVGGQLDATELTDLAAFRASLPPDAPLVTLLDFPRHDRAAQAVAKGATAVLGKPWRMEQLADSLAAVVSF